MKNFIVIICIILISGCNAKKEKEAFDRKVYEAEMGILSDCIKIYRKSSQAPNELYNKLELTLNKAEKICDYTDKLRDMTFKDEDYLKKLLKAEEVLKTYMFKIDSISADYYSKQP